MLLIELNKITRKMAVQLASEENWLKTYMMCKLSANFLPICKQAIAQKREQRMTKSKFPFVA